MTKSDQQQLLAEVSTSYTDICRLEHAVDEINEAIRCLLDHFRRVTEIARAQRPEGDANGH